ncbi:uncharacterized protein DUF4760 [Rhodobacter aestuarii]|uniref:DUF4760 domain-containing protein n=1 Tax=Rhodobacter aestuarii TaxID=453582 RepID=A0A1N7K829_9RHOB|nr:DUF4760 domain-containing protein [Rhodobacter aestuarii]PTV95817.1 uncharacterized protein DUF4760 [Rhodobacter aestuarii]SIS57739.1 protein of unknown function [Rhodobacter aestuarii]
MTEPLPQAVMASGNVFISYGPLISAGAVLVSAIVAGIIALRNIAEQRKIARRRATLDLISHREWDGDYIRIRAEFNKLKLSHPPLEFWAAEEHKDSPQITVIRSILNDYEMISIGIREGILDEALYKRWFRSSLVNDYQKAKATIDTIRQRTGVPTIYAEFQALAERWTSKK